MSALVMGLVWELPKTEFFGRAEKFVLLAYADHADSNGRNIYPSIELVTRKTFYEERAVQLTTRELEKHGYLIPDGQGPHGTNRWRIPIMLLHDGGAKITPVQNADVKNAPEEIAPEGNAPEEIAPEPSVVVIKSSTATAGDQSAEIFRMYESEIGLLTPLIRDAINGWMADIPHQWLIDAMRRAVVANKRSWAYVEAILRAWKTNGAQDTRVGKKESNYGNTGRNSGKSTKDKASAGSRRKGNDSAEYSRDDLAAAELINKR